MALPENAYAAQVISGLNEDKAPAIMAEIARQFDSADPAYGKTCVLESGSYRIDTDLVFDVNTKFSGIDPRSGFTGTVIRPRDGARSIVIDGNVKGSGGWAFNIEISNLLIWPEESTTRPREMMYFDKQYSNVIRNVKISPSQNTTALADYCVNIVGGNDLSFHNCRLGGTTGHATVGTLIDGAIVKITDGDAHFVRCDLEDSLYGVDFQGGHIVLNDCYMERCTHACFKINNNQNNQLNGKMVVLGGHYSVSPQWSFCTFDKRDGDQTTTPVGGSSVANGGGNIAFFFPLIKKDDTTTGFNVYSVTSTEIDEVYWYGPEPKFDINSPSEVRARDFISFNGAPS